MRFALTLLLAAAANGASADIARVTLHSAFTGPNTCLDIVNAGKRDQLHMASCGPYTGQMWEIAPDPENGFLRLRTRFTGVDMCLDVINDGSNDRLHMASCAKVSGQLWSKDRTDRGFGVRLWNQFTGGSKCLDVVNDGSGRVQLAPCGDYSGQYWNMSLFNAPSMPELYGH